jgi:hypothetical protein
MGTFVERGLEADALDVVEREDRSRRSEKRSGRELDRANKSELLTNNVGLKITNQKNFSESKTFKIIFPEIFDQDNYQLQSF